MGTWAWDKGEVILPDGRREQSICPVIISASRTTDIPAFFAKWFRERLRAGYVRWVNPFNANQVQYVSFERTRAVVFWSKNPKPLIQYLPELDQRGIKYYFQFTLNDYEQEGLEPNVPPLARRIETFKELSGLLGKKRVIWRFDPLILAGGLTVDALMGRVARVGDLLHGFTEQLVISFADIEKYAKVKNSLNRQGVPFAEFDDVMMQEAAAQVSDLNKTWKLKVSTCAEEIDLFARYGIQQNRCIDDRLMVDLFSDDPVLMEFLGHTPGLFAGAEVKYRKDPGQRKECGCFVSKDIGMYDTCSHLCVYCYANTSGRAVAARLRGHSVDGDALVG